MKFDGLIRNLDHITRKDTYLYYREEFSAVACYSLFGRIHSGRVEFSVETTPVGEKSVQVKLVDAIDYPLLPLVQALKRVVRLLIEKNQLPR
ncbi:MULTISPECIES: hypothetical protein [Treponema]|uniref:Uncharacterized protein n=7 Tax=Treponema TaxID=157 RepID=O83844_TREPA|nr:MULTISPECIES: hypothetical protein [Treponema]AAC65837.1 conserved hypothetical protein [Treponema pallidum subsp. pallidum str. Nichols]ACD71290.1 hypothetical protein TPASS_0874 [Treponema pallidum subsp. pallidum SS14]ADD72968.1 conserved hypothetical protein [Treponema pallidum subsp. pallidum str. Chicago]AEH40800.1 conserved hypothetical protein [Treponema paraluiscuniculi Cuniculi A]AEZ58008.1 hypothetical protein TPESAMD_0874 [Treponema pallidum subsp. pertenue str. SamoaD]